jgi:hypothetical protein
MAVKVNRPRSTVLVARHHPGSKYITRSYDHLGRDYSFNSIGGIKAELPMDGTIRKGQWDESSFCATVVIRDPLSLECNRDR